MKSGKISKITGLDPAKLYFSLDEESERLHETDADYVETLHTSKFGFGDPIGAVWYILLLLIFLILENRNFK